VLVVTADQDDLTSLAGRYSSQRSDTRRTHDRLIEAVNRWVAENGAPPDRLADVAQLAGVSTATAYRHFASARDAIQAFVLQLPVRAVELFATSGGAAGDPIEAFGRWNLAWVRACVEHGELAVHLRSSEGFLQRRDEGEPVITFACSQIEPLLNRLDSDTTMMLFMWNVTSDPREVLDLQRRGWSVERIAEFVTKAVLATPDP
jgi:AcrR family transcriptional regulator